MEISIKTGLPELQPKVCSYVRRRDSHSSYFGELIRSLPESVDTCELPSVGSFLRRGKGWKINTKSFRLISARTVRGLKVGKLCMLSQRPVLKFVRVCVCQYARVFYLYVCRTKKEHPRVLNP